eukprot:9502581-Pyramimonas_sp.AAC.2
MAEGGVPCEHRAVPRRGGEAGAVFRCGGEAGAVRAPHHRAHLIAVVGEGVGGPGAVRLPPHAHRAVFRRAGEAGAVRAPHHRGHPICVVGKGVGGPGAVHLPPHTQVVPRRGGEAGAVRAPHHQEHPLVVAGEGAGGPGAVRLTPYAHRGVARRGGEAGAVWAPHHRVHLIALAGEHSCGEKGVEGGGMRLPRLVSEDDPCGIRYFVREGECAHHPCLRVLINASVPIDYIEEKPRLHISRLLKRQRLLPLRLRALRLRNHRLVECDQRLPLRQRLLLLRLRQVPFCHCPLVPSNRRCRAHQQHAERQEEAQCRLLPPRVCARGPHVHVLQRRRPRLRPAAVGGPKPLPLCAQQLAP